MEKRVALRSVVLGICIVLFSLFGKAQDIQEGSNAALYTDSAGIMGIELLYEVHAIETKGFNSEYSDSLLSEQKDLLSMYITSFSDNGLQLKVFLNEEVERLKETLGGVASSEVIQDPNVKKRIKNVLTIVQEFKSKPVDLDLIQDILKVQTLVSEVENYGN